MIACLRTVSICLSRIAATLFCLLVGSHQSAGMGAWSHSEPGLSVELSDTVGGKSSGGFLVLAMAFDNATRNEITVRLNVTFEGRFRSEGGSVSARVPVPAGKGRTQVLFPAPYVDGLGSRIRVQCVGPTPTLSTQHHIFTHRTGNDGTAPFAIVGQEAGRFAMDLAKIFSGSDPSWTHSPPPLAERFQGKVPKIKRSSEGDFPLFSNLPHESRGFSSISGLWLDGSEWNAAPASTRAAVRDWVRAGGSLFLMTGGQTGAADLSPEIGTLGLGRVSLHEPLSPSSLKGFSEKILALDGSPFPGRVEDYAQWKSQLLPPFELNVRLLVGFLLGFVGLLLPVNFLWFAPVQKRHRIFVTVPAISLLAGFGLVWLAAATDGTGGIGIRNGLVLLGKKEEAAVLYQEQLSRTGMVSSSSFSLPEDASFVVCKTDRHDAFRSFRSGRDTGGDWFSSRSIQGHALQRWFRSEAEVVFQGEGEGGPVLVAKGFTPDGPLFYADKNGEYWTAARLVEGTPVTLIRTSAKDFEDWFMKRIAEPSSNLRARMHEALQRRDWFFTAIEGGGDFWIPTFSRVRWVRDQMVCLGPVRKEEKR